MRVPVLSRLGATDPRQLVANLTRSDTGRAAGLGAAAITQNMLALVFTIVFARLLGASGYGSLAVLISAYIILMVPGSALQIAAAREVSGELAAGSDAAAEGARRWLIRLALGTVVVAVIAIPARPLIGGLINVDDLWGAAAIPVTAMLWMILSVERGVLQGFRQYRTVAFSIVGEASSRIVFALVLVAAGLDVTGAFLGSALSFVAVGLVLLVPLHRRLPTPARGHGDRVGLRSLMAGARAPVIALTLLLALQELHVIIVKHEASGDAAGSYAVAAVAAKAIVWIAVGLAMYLVPETARRARTGADARPVLLRTFALIAGAGVPMVSIYAVAGEPLLRTVFGDDLTRASDALPWLGLAMVMLACDYLAVQFLLALHRWRFIWILGVALTVEVPLLVGIGADLTAVAIAVFAVQGACAGAVLFLSLRESTATLATSHPPEAAAQTAPIPPSPGEPVGATRAR